MSILISFILSVAAGVISHYICKWLDGKTDNGNEPKE